MPPRLEAPRSQPLPPGVPLYAQQTVEMYQQYSQAVDDEQGMRLVGCTFNESDIARVGIADTPGAYLVSRWVTEWERDDAT